jgi:hypothetical protein
MSLHEYCARPPPSPLPAPSPQMRPTLPVPNPCARGGHLSLTPSPRRLHGSSDVNLKALKHAKREKLMRSRSLSARSSSARGRSTSVASRSLTCPHNLSPRPPVLCHPRASAPCDPKPVAFFQVMQSSCVSLHCILDALHSSCALLQVTHHLLCSVLEDHPTPPCAPKP